MIVFFVLAAVAGMYGYNRYHDKAGDFLATSSLKARSKSVEITAASANIRIEPAKEAKIIAKASKGFKLTVIAEEANWFKVSLENGKNGWIHKSLATTRK